MNVAGYVRVSSEAQAENYSIPEQTDAIKNYCAAKGWNLIQTYIDGGYTGANMDRPELQNMLTKLDMYDIVLVYKLDRLSRSQKDVLYLIDRMNESSVKFASIIENFDTSTPLGMAMLGIMAAFAQLERETIKERMSLGRRGRIKKGLWRAGSNPPTGYDYIDGHLVIREDEAQQIRKIFELFLGGWTINKIRQYMHANYTNRYSSWAQTSSVSTVLRNEIYIGKLPSDRDGVSYPGEHEPIIDEITFKQAQRLLNARMEHFDESLKHPFKAKYLLTGITYCGQCGGRVSCTTSNHYSYYGCHKNSADPRNKMLPKCATPKYNTKKLEAIIVDEILKLSFDDSGIQAMIKPRKQVDHSKAIKSLERQKSRLIDLYATGAIEIEPLTIKINEITSKLDKLRQDRPQEPELSIEEAKQLFQDAKEIFTGDEPIEKQRAILQALIKKIVLSGNNIEIFWRFE